MEQRIKEIYQKYGIIFNDDNLTDLNYIMEHIIQSSKNSIKRHKNQIKQGFKIKSDLVDSEQLYYILRNRKSNKAKEIVNEINVTNKNQIKNNNNLYEINYEGKIVLCIFKNNQIWFNYDDLIKINNLNNDPRKREFSKDILSNDNKYYLSDLTDEDYQKSNRIFINGFGLLSFLECFRCTKVSKMIDYLFKNIYKQFGIEKIILNYSNLDNTKYLVDNYTHFDCNYILKIKNMDNTFKFGRSSNVKERFRKHKSIYGEFEIVRIYKFLEHSYSKAYESNIKSIIKINKLNCKKGSLSELFKIKNEDQLKNLLNELDEEFKENGNGFNVIDNRVYSEFKHKEYIKIIYDENEFKNELNVNPINNKNIKMKKIIKRKKISPNKIESDKRYQEKRKTINNQLKQCIDCKTPVKDTKILRCVKCNSAKKFEEATKDRPSLETLQNNVKELGYRGTGRLYNVTDNTIRKWISKYQKHA